MTPNSISLPPLSPPLSAHNLFPVLYSILLVISIPTNGITLGVSCSQMRKKNELGVYLFSLSLADLLYTLTLPLWIIYAQNGDNWTLLPSLCTFSVFARYVNYYTSAGFLTCISIDRYLAVVHPFKLQYMRTRRFALLVSILVWVLEISSSYLILLKDEIFIRPINSTNHTICYDTYPLEEWQANLNLYRVFFGYMIPLAIIAFCYQKIYHAVEHNQATEKSEKKKIKKLLLSIIITFFFCFTPYHVVLLIRSIGERQQNCNFAKTMFKPYRITTAITSLNCIADPILYCFVSETGRTDIQNMFKCCLLRKQKTLSHTREVAMSSIITKNGTDATLESTTCM
uniref:G protein-coupled receptor 65 n=1 Tax=Sphenodon punctatus TaxID=8508 RepID=A0A8D0HIN5_SPHPU